MRRVVILILAPIMFMQCTDQLYEIDQVISQNVERINTPMASEIPTNVYFTSYYDNTNPEKVHLTKLEGNVLHNFQDEQKVSGIESIPGVQWVGDFEFTPGVYEFNVQSDKGIKVLVDGEVVIDDQDNKRQTSYRTFVPANGIRRILVLYNIDKKRVRDLILEYYEYLNSDNEASERTDPRRLLHQTITNQSEIARIRSEQPAVLVSWKLAK